MNVFRPAVAPGFLAFATLTPSPSPIKGEGRIVFVFVVEPEFTVDRDICPTVGIEDGAIALGMELAQFQVVGVKPVGVVEAVLGGGEVFVVAHHEVGAELVVCFACTSRVKLSRVKTTNASEKPFLVA